VRLDALVGRTSLGGHAATLAGRSVLVASRDPVAAALALIELDGVARRLIVCPPDVPSAQLSAVIAQAEVEAIVADPERDVAGLGVPSFSSHTTVTPATEVPDADHDTEWVLLTSGTTGAPKLLVHTVASLTAPIGARLGSGDDVVWGTFYDIRRYGGLQIFFRALFGRGSFVLTGVGESIGEYLTRLSAHGATHVSGTPSHWRRVLMSPEARAIAPRYVRLSGEIADQGILNALRACYPDAGLGHAFASTEAGVGFEVDDGLEGFPARLVGAPGAVQIQVEDGSLRLRSTRSAVRALGDDIPIADADGFVDTGDMVERRGDRYYFLGRRSGLINVGGLKVYPEEVEAAINRHPAVRMSRVRAKKSPLIGSLVAAEVVLTTGPCAGDIEREIRQICHDTLAPYKIPATIRFVPALAIADAGKLARHA
jgi:acyl-coenzyme A synthetase/AMP-(fatty) acid ligase